ncbi:diadenylate cyclase CdaA [Owenweeksia hongkongensis]|uniref:Diadenylate cyclase n=1 Tax=Owenweeksia hongkongensis (strain DSM 17368 / CIP 108786 / JCM 12287 / NRRL B-23963 / UST20020801) TaxID=926562 RepID=G8R4Y1_OWEHD|nr:diadenylate cyclase CdaA [Owenweeksia hongkongensis]AEV34295.1 TIGR00159 family protein [Owenweeksia hongkongensis DSM 17368]
MSFIDFGILDAIDILLVAFLLYQLYRLIRGTVAINIFIGVAAIYLIWKLVEALQMELLSEILGKFIGVGVIALVIVFQQEIRKFLLLLGSTNFTHRRRFLRQLKILRDDNEPNIAISEIAEACRHMADSKTGALIVLERKSGLGSYVDTGTRINSQTSAQLLESIFNKHSPLHDGAVIISGEKLLAAGCILPVTEKTSLPSRFGLRHRAAIGIAEKTDALAIVVSEESGSISIAIGDEFINKVTAAELPKHVLDYLRD